MCQFIGFFCNSIPLKLRDLAKKSREELFIPSVNDFEQTEKRSGLITSETGQSGPSNCFC